MGDKKEPDPLRVLPCLFNLLQDQPGRGRYARLHQGREAVPPDQVHGEEGVAQEPDPVGQLSGIFAAGHLHLHQGRQVAPAVELRHDPLFGHIPVEALREVAQAAL